MGKRKAVLELVTIYTSIMIPYDPDEDITGRPISTLYTDYMVVAVPAPGSGKMRPHTRIPSKTIAVEWAGRFRTKMWKDPIRSIRMRRAVTLAALRLAERTGAEPTTHLLKLCWPSLLPQEWRKPIEFYIQTNIEPSDGIMNVEYTECSIGRDHEEAQSIHFGY